MRKLPLLLLLLFCFVSVHAQLCINEVMQSNVDCIVTDDLNGTPDSWVELYNGGTRAINISTYKLGLTENPDEAFQLPSVIVPSKGRTLIYCDKEGKNNHTNFRLESGKDGSIYLFNSAGEIIDSYVKMKKQPAPNISYGRETDGGTTLGYMLKPTPNAANAGGVVSNKMILGEPVFSVSGRVFTESKNVRVAISLPEGSPEGTVIRYTTDGTEPTENSTKYSGSALMFNTTQIIRAKLFCDGYLSPRSTTHSYIFHNRTMTVPVVSITTDNSYFYNDKIGIYVEGSYKSGEKNYNYEWRRPINIEYFDASGADAAINQLCETRVQGGATRGNPLKSLAVYANKRFGEKRFTYEFFPTEKPGLTEFKSIILRNSGNDFDYLYFRDAAIQHNAAMNCDLDWQGWQPAVFYFNGKYMGMLNVRERSNEDNIYSNYEKLEDIDMVENWWELKEGTWDKYNELKDFYTASANAENTNMDSYTDKMDIDEFINLMAVNIFHNNLDFPGNNIVMWRPRTDDGKWRWIMKDTDFGLGLYGRDYKYKYIDWLYYHDYDKDNQWANEYEHTRLFRRLMTDQRFKDRFIDRMTVFMGSFMNGYGLGEVVDSMYNVIKTEYPYHRKLFNEWWPNHQEEYTKTKEWAKNRTTFMWTYLKDYYKLDETTLLNVNTRDIKSLENFRLILNDTPVKKGYYSGNFWKGREVRVAAESLNGEQEVSEWQVLTNVMGQTSTKTYKGNNCSFVMPTNASVVVVTPVITATGIESVEEDQQNATSAFADGIYTMDGKKVSAPTKPGIYIIKKGDTVKKIVKN